jgi:hypothetical protein
MLMGANNDTESGADLREYPTPGAAEFASHFDRPMFVTVGALSSGLLVLLVVISSTALLSGMGFFTGDILSATALVVFAGIGSYGLILLTLGILGYGQLTGQLALDSERLSDAYQYVPKEVFSDEALERAMPDDGGG